jgi:hypothetical protein
MIVTGMTHWRIVVGVRVSFFQIILQMIAMLMMFHA